MGQLPFLVAHGALVSKLLVVGGGALGIAATRLVGRHRDRVRLAAERRARAADLRSLAPGTATISGTLRGRAATASSAVGKVLRTRSDELVLEVEGKCVALRGEVEVTAGTRAKAAWGRVPRGFAAGGERGDWRVVEVRDGDSVIARGKLTHSAGGAGGDYRESAGVWALEPLVDVPVIELFAAKPASTAPPIHPVRVAVVAVVAMTIAYAALSALGSSLVSSNRTLAHRSELPRALVIAAALPHVRDAALDGLEKALADELPHDDQTIDQRLELLELRRGCVARARLEVYEERYEQAVITARRCGVFDVQITALVLLGRYEDAHALVPRDHVLSPGPAAVVAIATGDWKLAAQAADESSRGREQFRARYRCLASWFRAKAGETVQMSPDPDDITCAIVRAMLLPADQRGAALKLVSMAFPHTGIASSSLRHLAGELAWAYGIPDEPSTADLYAAVAQLIGGDPQHLRGWLAPLAQATRGGDAEDRWLVLAERAANVMIRGDRALAEASLREASASVPGDRRPDLDAVRIAVALHGPDPIAFDPLVPRPLQSTAPLATLRGGHTATGLVAMTYGRDVLDAALEAALAGDGAPLARALLTEHPMWEADVGPILAVLPYVTTNRDQLIAALRDFHGVLASEVEQAPFAIVAEAALHRDLARLAGDPASTERWQQIVSAHARVLDDPEKVIALLLWQRG